MKILDAPPEDGACTGHPTEWWFPILAKTQLYGLTVKSQRENMAEAIRICNTCIVQRDCLEYSLRHEPVGIWGGFTEVERDQIRISRSIKASRPVNSNTRRWRRWHEKRAQAAG